MMKNVKTKIMYFFLSGWRSRSREALPEVGVQSNFVLSSFSYEGGLIGLTSDFSHKWRKKCIFFLFFFRIEKQNLNVNHAQEFSHGGTG